MTRNTSSIPQECNISYNDLLEAPKTPHRQTIQPQCDPPDLSQRLAHIYDRAATRYRDHQAAQHERITRALSGFTVESATIGGMTCQRVIVAAKHEARAA